MSLRRINRNDRQAAVLCLLLALTAAGWWWSAPESSPAQTSVTAAAAVGGQLPLMVKPADGVGAADATKKVEQVLQRISTFRLAPAPGAPVASVTVGSGMLEGRLQAGDGRELFDRKYGTGHLDRDAKQFADDIVYTLTKRPGIATSQIAFSFSEAGKAHQIYLCDFDGANVRQITERGANVAPALSPDGTRLAHVALQKGDLGVVRVVDLAKGKPLGVETPPARRIETAFSPDGKQLALSMSTDTGPNSELYLIKLPRGKAVPLTTTPVPESSPSWSPDGKRIVFAAPPAPGRSELFIMDVKKKTTTPLPTGQSMAIDPAWSPDGDHIAFVSVESGNRRTICLRNLQNGKTQRLTSGSQPYWGADSRHLLFATSSGGLSMIRVDTGKISPVVVGGGRAIDPSWTR